MKQREIKFRAWVKADSGYGQMVYPHLVMTDGIFFLPANYVLQQYTDLKDKNGKGKEVYEGDLIQVCFNEYEPREIYEVVWDEERLEWGVKNKGGFITSLWTFYKDFEVIGNIYENPELLTPNK